MRSWWSVIVSCAALLCVAPLGAQDVAGRIERFGFNSRNSMGVGGFITVTVYPVVLFRDGSALLDIKALSDPDGLDAHRQRHAEAWTRWRRQDSTIEIESRGAWKPLSFKTTYTALPPDFRLNGRYRSIGGVGDVATGGASSVTVVSEYTFAADGTVTRLRAAGASVSGGSGSVVSSNITAPRQGRYTIEGVRLQIEYDDGSVETRILVTNPQDAKGAIWLDGAGYVLRR